MRALILFAHGSLHPKSGEEVAALAADLCRAAVAPIVAYAFMEIAEPRLDEAIERVIADGGTVVDVLPLFLNTGNHVVRDIPELVAAARTRHPDVPIRLLRHVGSHPGYRALVEGSARDPQGSYSAG